MAKFPAPCQLKALATLSFMGAYIAITACAPPTEPVEPHGGPEQPVERGEITLPLHDEDNALQAEGVQPPEHLLAPVLADASERSGVAAEELVVSGSWHRTWSDGSMGCPQPGMHYTQALVTGWRVAIQAGEQLLDYRISDRGYFTLCPDGIEVGVVPTVER
jgi:hypothetical protein